MESLHLKVFAVSVARILDIACYSYYVEADNFISDSTFDELEKVYCRLTGEKTYPMRGIELAEKYTTSTKIVYEVLNMSKKEKTEEVAERKQLKPLQKRNF